MQSASKIPPAGTLGGVMDNQTCPYCGDEKGYKSQHYYRCGSWIDEHEEHISGKCYNRQIANLEAQIADLQNRLEAWKAYRKAMKQWDYLDGIRESTKLELHKLKELGEI